jgi:hypothetical protein
MVYEKWDTQFDIQLLKKHLYDFVIPLEICKASETFGGWSLLSSNGSYKDGWHKGNKLINTATDTEDYVKKLESIGAKLTSEYIHPTEICHGYMLEVVNKLREKGLNPRRMRIIRLVAHGSCLWHSDVPEHKYVVRLHIPIETNGGCFFETRTEKAFLPADGSSYFIFVNREHRVVNDGDTPRYHIVADVTDHACLTQYHQFSVEKYLIGNPVESSRTIVT